MAVRLEQQCRKRRRQRERHHRRDDGRSRDRERELPVELARDAGDEGRRNEDGAEHERDRDQRTADLVHGLVGGVARAQARAQIALNVLHHHDGIVHHDADREDEAEQREIVKREAERRHDEEGPDQRDRDGNDRDDGGAPGLQKQDDDNHDQHDRLEQRRDHLVDRLLDELGRVVGDPVAHARGEALGELLHGVEHGAGGRECIGAGPLEDADGGGHLIVEIRVGGVAERAELDPRDVAHARHASVGVGSDHDVVELLRTRQPPERLHRKLESARRRGRWLIDRTSSHLDIGAPQRRDHVAWSQSARLHERWVEPHPHRVVARSKHDDVADAIEARDHILDVDGCVIRDVLLVQASVG